MAPPLTLYGFRRSSCTSRLRLSLLTKGIPFQYLPVNIEPGTDHQHTDDYIRLNPSRTVPTLIVTAADADPAGQDNPTVITQSLAALEYLEEAFPDATPLLPRGGDAQAIRARALIRSLAGAIVADIQPVSNTVVLGWVEGLGGDRMRWARDVHVRGLRAVEGILAGSGCKGRFCVGEGVTLADVCLVPVVWNALTSGVDFAQFPTVKNVFEHLSGLGGPWKGEWRNEEDVAREY